MFDNTEMMKRFALQRRAYGTQEKLASALDVNPKAISAYETGRKNPSLEMFVRMCSEIGANVNYIIYGKENKSDD